MRESLQVAMKVVNDNKHLISSVFLLLLSWLVVSKMIKWISF
jgi:hypothetical protein